YQVQTVTLETYPGFYLTGTLFLPPGEGPFPAILSPHGHWSEGRFEDIERASIPGRALNFAKRGFAVFSYSMIGYNETEDFFPHRFDTPQYQLWGFSAMGLQLWNSIRALDYLGSRKEVDADRIGMTGASGGGTQTFLLTAIDDRIRVAAPVNMISAHFQGGCICENAPLLRHSINNVEIGSLAAPRPLLLVSTSGDWTLNTPNLEFPAIQQIYSLFDASSRVENAHFDYPHNYNKATRESVYTWFEKWLGNQTSSEQESPFILPPSTTANAVLPDTPLSEPQLFASFKAQGTQHLLLNTPTSWSQLNTFKASYGRALEHSLYVEEELPVELTTVKATDHTAASDAILIIHGSSGESHQKAKKIAEAYSAKGILAAMLTNTNSLDGFNQPIDSVSYWTTYNPTFAQAKVHRIISAARTLNARPDVRHVDLIGLDDAGAHTLLARSQLSFIRTTQVDFNGLAYESDDIFLKHLQIPLLRRAGDFKTAVAMTVPGSLTIQNLPNSELKSWIRRLYNELGAGDMLSFE
ncbi:MAG: acetylxylan esterase, partial [Rhodothermaceae bacterium]|nr:acetylxylan esterase [Rhodothermaceae bacterium]